ncbi:unnamed protein product [Closterium sp. Yama58-4]|nr:unnamed protein product [Closterium sp. Yama58-4]
MVAFSFNAIPRHKSVSVKLRSSIEERSGPKSLFGSEFARAIFAESGYNIAADSQSGPCSTSVSVAGSAGSGSENSGEQAEGDSSSSSAFPSPSSFIPLPPVLAGDAHPPPAPVKEQFLWRNPRSHGYAKCNAEGKKGAALKGRRKGSRGALHSRLRGRPSKSAVEHAARAMAMAEWERKVQDPARRKRVLIMMSDTGGGHRASAEALKSTFEMEFGDKYDVNVVDFWTDHTPWPFNQLPKSYNFLVRHETLWKMAYYATTPKFVHQPQMAATFAFVARAVSKGLDKYKPDVIVSVHPSMQHVPLRVLKSRGLLHRIPFITVVTDLTTCHPTWFNRQVTVCFCPTKEVAQQALKAGLQPSQIRVHGLPIRPAFAKPSAPQAEVRQSLGMDPELPAVLLIGGGEGMGPVEETARALVKTLAPETPGGRAKGQLIIICGRNKQLQATLEAMTWPMPTQIKGVVTNIPEIMAASDCVISKAGPGTIAESMIKGLPMILNDFVPGQEVGNVPFVVKNGAGLYEENPQKIAQIVADWFGPNVDQFKRMATNARRLARPDAVFRIVRDIDQLANRPHTLDNVTFAYS